MRFLIDLEADSNVASILMVINDAPLGKIAQVGRFDERYSDFEMTSEALRESKLKEVLAEHGVEVQFVNIPFVIKRSEWLRGEGKASYLWRVKDNLKCCLGLLGRECGASHRVLQGHSSYAHAFETATADVRADALPSVLSFLLCDDGLDSPTANELMAVNDCALGNLVQLNQFNNGHDDFVLATEEQRESTLAALFLAQGFEVTFVD